MTRYPRSIRDAKIKCIACNAPVAITVDDRYVCVECGESPIEEKSAVNQSTSPNAVADDD